MYNIDWSNILKHLLHKAKQKPFRLAWLTLLLSQTKFIHAEFLTFIADKKYIAKFRFSKVYMEKLLNDQFDPVNQGIIIERNPIRVPPYVFRTDENQPLGLYRTNENQPIILYRKEETSGKGFKVLVPSGVQFDESEMRAWINIYCYYGIKYTINIV